MRGKREEEKREEGRDEEAVNGAGHSAGGVDK